MRKLKEIIIEIFRIIYKTLFKKEPCVFFTRTTSYNQRGKGLKDPLECPFCSNNKEIKDIREKYNFFYIKGNDYPYYRTKEHLLIVPYRHIYKWGELTIDEQKELIKIINIKLDKGYMILGRHYEIDKQEQKSGASIPHLHIHLIINDL